MAITINAAADSLKRHSITYAKDISTALRQGMEWENPAVANARQTLHTYTAPTATVTEVIQAYQCPFTPKSGVDLNSVDTALERLKVDVLVSCDDIEKFYASWMAEWFEIGKDPKTWSFARYLWDKLIIPKMIEEQNWNYFNAIKVAPTLNTAGNSIDSMTGLKKKIADWITAGNLVPVATGAITSANIVSKVEQFVDALPPVHQKRGGVILMSQTMANWYARDYRAQFGTGNGVAGNENAGLKIDNTNKSIIGMASMEGSQRIIYSPDLIWLKRISESYLPTPEVSTDIRTLKLSMVYHRAIGVEYFFNTFVNDQA